MILNEILYINTPHNTIYLSSILYNSTPIPINTNRYSIINTCFNTNLESFDSIDSNNVIITTISAITRLINIVFISFIMILFYLIVNVMLCHDVHHYAKQCTKTDSAICIAIKPNDL